MSRYADDDRGSRPFAGQRDGRVLALPPTPFTTPAVMPLLTTETVAKPMVKRAAFTPDRERARKQASPDRQPLAAIAWR